MRSVTLPDGTVVRNVPDDVSDEQVFSMVAATPSAQPMRPPAPDIKTGADYFPLAGEIIGGVGGGIAGGALAGTAVMPGIGTFVGGLLGGALGTFGGSFVGQAAEASYEQRDFQVQEAAGKAGRAAALDSVFGLGLGAAGQVVKAIGAPLYRMFRPAIKPLPELDLAMELQQKLEPFGTSLLPSQIGDTSATSRISEAYASSSIGFETEFKQMMDGYDTFAASQVDELMRQLPKTSREDLGQRLVSLVDETSTAVDEHVAPLYMDIDTRGGINLDTTFLKEAAHSMMSRAGANMTSATKKAADVVRAIDSLSGVVTPAQLTQELAPMLRTLESVARGDRMAMAIINAVKAQVRRAEANPAFVQTDKLKPILNRIRSERVNKAGETQASSAETQAYEYLSNMRDRMSFTEARRELSYIKGRVRDLDKSTAPDSAAVRMWSAAIPKMEQLMDEAAQRLGGNLYDDYRKVSDFYKNASEVLTAPYISKMLKNNEVAKAGEALFRLGEVTPVRQVDEVVALAESLNVGGGKTARDMLTQRYLQSMLSSPTINSLDILATKMKDERFLDTFDRVVPSDIGDKLKTLFLEAQLIAKHGYGSSAGQSLAIRSRELGSITSPAKWQSVVFGLAPEIVAGRLSNETITAKLNAMKAVRTALQQGRQPPGRALRFITETIPMASVPAGFALGAPIEQ